MPTVKDDGDKRSRIKDSMEGRPAHVQQYRAQAKKVETIPFDQWEAEIFHFAKKFHTAYQDITDSLKKGEIYILGPASESFVFFAKKLFNTLGKSANLPQDVDAEAAAKILSYAQEMLSSHFAAMVVYFKKAQTAGYKGIHKKLLEAGEAKLYEAYKPMDKFLRHKSEALSTELKEGLKSRPKHP